MKKTSTYKALLALTVALGTQAQSAMAGDGTVARKSVETTTQSMMQSTSQSRSWVTLKARTDKKVYSVGQPIRVSLTAANTFKRGAYLSFTSGQRFDFSVYKAGSSETVYTWSATRMFAQAMGSLWLKPGQSQNYDANVGEELSALEPGKYRLVARLTNSPRPIVAAPIHFEIAAPTLTVTARTDKTTYKVGEEVKIFVAITNRAQRENVADIRSGMIADFLVSDENGAPVWNYTANLRFVRILGETSWKAGETKNLSATWNGIALPRETVGAAVPPGRYRVQGVLSTNPAVFSKPVYIRVTN